MKILILGCRGQVGVELMRAAWDSGTEVTGLARPQFDITSTDDIEAALANLRPQIVVNAAAYTAVDQAETDQAWAFAVNAFGPEALAAACSRRGLPLIHLSTDYVFDGSAARPYRESDRINPINAYGRSKAAGEAGVRHRQPQHVIVRTAWVYAGHGNNFVKTMLRLAGERDELGVVADQRGTPTAAADIAAAVVSIARRIASASQGQAEDVWGTYHFSARGSTSWHGFADHIFGYLERVRRKRPLLRAITTADYPTPARRPANSSLDCALIEQTFGIGRSTWEESLGRVLAELVPHELISPRSWEKR